jgi:hypothetical protein
VRFLPCSVRSGATTVGIYCSLGVANIQVAQYTGGLQRGLVRPGLEGATRARIRPNMTRPACRPGANARHLCHRLAPAHKDICAWGLGNATGWQAAKSGWHCAQTTCPSALVVASMASPPVASARVPPRPGHKSVHMSGEKECARLHRSVRQGVHKSGHTGVQMGAHMSFI